MSTKIDLDWIMAAMRMIYREKMLPMLDKEGHPYPTEDNFLRKWWMALDPIGPDDNIDHAINHIVDIGSKLLDSYVNAIKEKKRIPFTCKINSSTWYQPITF